MSRLVRSSNPGDVDRDTAVRLLAERAVLTRAICRELLETDGRYGERRPAIAMYFLLRWVHENLPDSVRIEPHPSDGIDSMVVPDNCGELLKEIRAGAQVAEDLFMLWTADTPSQAAGDEARIRRSLEAYWINHRSTASAPSAISSWSGLKKEPPSGGTP